MGDYSQQEKAYLVARMKKMIEEAGIASDGSAVLKNLALVNVDEHTIMTDYVYARGTSGNWTYWKWCSGLAVCIHKPIQGGNFGNAAWGALYDTPEIGFSAYPFPFVEAPVCVPARAGTDAAEYSQYFAMLAQSGGDTTQPPAVDLVRATQATIGHPYVTIMAIGRWK